MGAVITQMNYVCRITLYQTVFGQNDVKKREC